MGDPAESLGVVVFPVPCTHTRTPDVQLHVGRMHNFSGISLAWVRRFSPIDFCVFYTCVYRFLRIFWFLVFRQLNL